MKTIWTVSAMALMLAACASVERTAAPQIISDQSVEGHRVAAIRSGDQDPENDMICKSQVITGSRAMKRVCHTRGDWVAMRRNGEDAVRTTLQRPTSHFDNEDCGKTGNCL